MLAVDECIYVKYCFCFIYIQLKGCCRYINDIFVPNYRYFENIVYKVYPSELKNSRQGKDIKKN